MNDAEQPVSFAASTDAWVARQELPSSTSQISYHSAGHCLFIATELDTALLHLDTLSKNGVTVVVIDAAAPAIEKQLLDNGVAVFTVPKLLLTGHLGAFQAVAVDATRELDLAVAVFRESGAFDVVLDCAGVSFIKMDLKPFGYAYCAEPDTIAESCQALLGFVGEFDKPKYFDYELSVCAHSRSQLDGCSRCIDVCSTGAIRQEGEGVSVDPYLCQGCGTCATVCPTGAMSYAYPRPANAIERTRELLRDSHANTLLLYSEKHQQQIDALALDASIQALLVEEVTAYGLDYWLSLLAGHVQRIVVVVECTDVERAALESQQALLHELLRGLGVEESALHLMPVEDVNNWADLPAPVGALAAMAKTSFSTHNNKRQTIRLALDELSAMLMQRLPEPVQTTPLSAGSPFGAVLVNTSSCTLCLACVSTCPSKALQDGQDLPALKFIESNCVQCGLCEQACPESAITLLPQYRWDSVAARQLETLNDAEPFHCISCHAAFATQGVISAMTARLGAHWMFQDENSLRRLKMCGDCRVKDIFREDAGGIATHKDEV